MDEVVPALLSAFSFAKRFLQMELLNIVLRIIFRHALRSSNAFIALHLFFESCVTYKSGCEIFKLNIDTIGKKYRSLHMLFFLSRSSSVWHYRLWSFKTRYTKLERFLHKNQHTQRKLLNFENWTKVSYLDFS